MADRRQRRWQGWFRGLAHTQGRPWWLDESEHGYGGIEPSKSHGGLTPGISTGSSGIGRRLHLQVQSGKQCGPSTFGSEGMFGGSSEE